MSINLESSTNDIVLYSIDCTYKYMYARQCFVPHYFTYMYTTQFNHRLLALILSYHNYIFSFSSISTRELWFNFFYRYACNTFCLSGTTPNPIYCIYRIVYMCCINAKHTHMKIGTSNKLAKNIMRYKGKLH